MSVRLTEEERNRIIDNLLFYRHDAFGGLPRSGLFSDCPLNPMTTVPPLGWSQGQYQALLIYYNRTCQSSTVTGHYTFQQSPILDVMPGPVNQPMKAPVSIPSEPTTGPSGPLMIQASRIQLFKKAAVVTPVKRTPSPSSTAPSVPSNLAWRAFSNEISMVEMLMELPQDIRHDVYLSAIHIERPSLDQPWGLGFVNVGADRLIISNAKWNHHVTCHWCRGAKIRAKECRDISFDPMSIYTTKPLIECRNDAMYASRLLSAMSIPKECSGCFDGDRQLYPGDLVLAIDGHSMPSFGSLVSVVDHLKSVHMTTIMVARCIEFKAASACFKDSPSEIVTMAIKAWNKISPLPTRPSHRTQTSPVHRPLFTKPSRPPPVVLRNPLFQGEDGLDLPYDDNHMLYIPDDGTSAKMFLPPIDDFQHWLKQRKEAWRRKYTVFKHGHEGCEKRRISTSTLEKRYVEICCTVATDFWSQQGFTSFSDWMASRVRQWKMSYSWNKRKRKRIQEDCEEIVHISTETCQFTHWLNVRRRQWRLQRRKRQRRKVETSSGEFVPVENDSVLAFSSTAASSIPESTPITSKKFCTTRKFSSEDKEMAILDEIIEAEEAQRQKRARIKSVPIDIARFFDSANGIPDDIVVKCFEYLERKEHVRVLSIDRGTSKSLQARENVWKSLCPANWILPRRPRKPWHELYCCRLKSEYEQHQKRWDDLLVRCAAILDVSDALCKIEKLIEEAQSSFGFDVDYVSGVVCERNSLLNLAVIHKRHKVTRWLVDVKGADIETFDRGNFTPLLNAAWGGDRMLVRFFLQKGADRGVRGTQHYSKAIAPPGFEGMTADQWAEKRGHPEVAKLIRLGL
ncbi:ankyrin repeat domain protein [Nitzschia inconspicua]|uniref:Ankyrin repeat domain protein n=1 Tax=Nitzschia inconspicua TaxID=303405 RepID=A0A9K3KUS4_9STRA|nr:ankyrin repeat domain protein [Nitzschia inconspicua]